MDKTDWFNEEDVEEKENGSFLDLDEEEENDDSFSDVLELWREYNDYLETLDNKDYVINKPQMAKLLKLYDFFVKALENQSSRVELAALVPKELHGGLDVHCNLLYLYGDLIKEFSEVITNASAISIDALLDGTVNISMTVPNVYKHK